MMSHRAILMLGSNLPGREARLDVLDQAMEQLRRLINVSWRSVMYDSRDYNDPVSGCKYTNCVVLGITNLKTDRLLGQLQSIETAMGRVRGNETVNIDIDLVVYDGEVVKNEEFASGVFQQLYGEYEQENGDN